MPSGIPTFPLARDTERSKEKDGPELGAEDPNLHGSSSACVWHLIWSLQGYLIRQESQLCCSKVDVKRFTEAHGDPIQKRRVGCEGLWKFAHSSDRVAGHSSTAPLSCSPITFPCAVKSARWRSEKITSQTVLWW